METFYFGRLNYISKHSLLDLINNGNKWSKDNHKFGLFQISTFEDPSLGLIVTGELVKYEKYKEEEVIKDGKLTTQFIEDAVRGKSKFFLSLDSHIITYNPYGSIISPNQFRQSFSGIIIGADDSFEVDSLIYPINNEYDFMNFLKNDMKKLNKIEIKLTPSNPNNREKWKSIDDRLNSINAKTSKEIIEAKDGYSLEVDDDIESKVAMSEDGYGKVKGEGLDNDDNYVTISTDDKDSLMKKKVDEDVSDESVWVKLKEGYESIIKRFKG